MPLSRHPEKPQAVLSMMDLPSAAGAGVALRHPRAGMHQLNWVGPIRGAPRHPGKAPAELVEPPDAGEGCSGGADACLFEPVPAGSLSYHQARACTAQQWRQSQGRTERAAGAAVSGHNQSGATGLCAKAMLILSAS